MKNKRLMKVPSYNREAKILLDQCKITEPPVKLSEVIKKCVEIKVVFDDIDGDGYLVDLGVLGSQVLIKKQAPVVRQRFTLAHEIGHWVLNKKNISPCIDNCSIEEWCNKFAAELLIPSNWFRNNVLELGINNFWEIFDLPPRYVVSLESLLHKVPEVTPINVHLIKMNGGSIKVEQNKSYEAPISFVAYKDKIMSQLLTSTMRSRFLVDVKTYCFYQLLYSSGEKKEIVVFLLYSRDGLTISSSGHF